MKRQITGTIYLLHFSAPFKHAKHYTGWALDVSVRLTEHANGTGARLMQVIAEQGISFTLARTWSGTRKDERLLKNQKNAPRLCPFCNPKAIY